MRKAQPQGGKSPLSLEQIADALGRISLPQFAWAVMLTRDNLWHFLEQECLSDSIIQLHGEIELQRHLNQFFDRAVYYGILGYLDPERHESPKTKKSERFEELALQTLQRLSLS